MEVHDSESWYFRKNPEAIAMDLQQRVQAIHGRHDFVDFVRALLVSLDTESAAWQNCDLGTYLDAIAAWTEDMGGYFENAGTPEPDEPTWKTLAQVMLAARVYE